MAEYKTEQRRQLIEYMTSNPTLALSIDDWLLKMKQEYKAKIPSRSTFYRTMRKLESEGMVVRCMEGKVRTCRYQIAKCPEHRHFHLKCTECGTLIHMSHEASKALEKKIFSDKNFNINEKQTVIYGICAQCNS